MRRTDFRRRKQSRRKPETQSDQSAGDDGKTEPQMMGDVFQKDMARLDLGDDPLDMRPQPALVRGRSPLAADAVRLARIARSDDIHDAAPRAAVEAGNIVPDRRRIQGLVFHPRHENGRGIGVPFDETNSTISGLGEHEPEVEAAGAGAQAEPPQGALRRRGEGR